MRCFVSDSSEGTVVPVPLCPVCAAVVVECGEQFSQAHFPGVIPRRIRVMRSQCMECRFNTLRSRRSFRINAPSVQGIQDYVRLALSLFQFDCLLVTPTDQLSRSTAAGNLLGAFCSDRAARTELAFPSRRYMEIHPLHRVFSLELRRLTAYSARSSLEAMAHVLVAE